MVVTAVVKHCVLPATTENQRYHPNLDNTKSRARRFYLPQRQKLLSMHKTRRQTSQTAFQRRKRIVKATLNEQYRSSETDCKNCSTKRTIAVAKAPSSKARRQRSTKNITTACAAKLTQNEKYAKKIRCGNRT